MMLTIGEMCLAVIAGIFIGCVIVAIVVRWATKGAVGRGLGW